MPLYLLFSERRWKKAWRSISLMLVFFDQQYMQANKIQSSEWQYWKLLHKTLCWLLVSVCGQIWGLWRPPSSTWEYPILTSPSMRAHTVALYMRYKTWEKGTCLLDEDNQAIYNVDGAPVILLAKWRIQGTIISTCLAKLHISINQDGLYIDACDAYHNEYKADKSSSGCSFHPGQCCIWRRGNPCESELVQNV